MRNTLLAIDALAFVAILTSELKGEGQYVQDASMKERFATYVASNGGISVAKQGRCTFGTVNITENARCSWFFMTPLETERKAA